MSSDSYGVLIWRLNQAAPRAFSFSHPADALAAAVDYLRAGYQVRLTDSTCRALEDMRLPARRNRPGSQPQADLHHGTR